MYDVKNLVTMKKIILLILCGVAWSLEGFCATKIESFSVSPETKVIFSKGNVQYHPKKNLWRFAPNQYDVIGEKNAKVSISYNGWIDLFGWGTGNQPCRTTDNNKDYSDFVDWGTNFPEEDASWRTLTQKEWRYLLLERENASKLVGIGKVAGVSGVFILPDNAHVFNSKINFVSLADQDVVKKWTRYSWNNEIVLNTYTAKQWETLETIGIVFLPFAGKRDVKTTEQIGDSGYYWTSDNDPTTLLRSYGLLISNTKINITQPISKQTGCAIRLVNNIK